MIIPANKKVVCITGNVWTGSRRAPRHLLVKDGYRRPIWFTTRRPRTDAVYYPISDAEFHLQKAKNNVLAYIKYSGGFVGVLRSEFLLALKQSMRGTLIVGPQDLVAQVAEDVPQLKVFALKDKHMTVSRHLQKADRRGQVHRLDIDTLQPGAWTEVYTQISEKLGIPVENVSFQNTPFQLK